MQNSNSNREQVLLGLLQSVERDGRRSQRHMASEFGVALGLINTYLKYCMRKGYVKVKRIPAGRYVYFLTPKGAAEKSRLIVAHLSNSLVFFRRAREDCTHVIEHAAARGWYRLALCGVGDLADIAFLCAEGKAASLVGIIDRNCPASTCRGLPVVRDIDALAPFDAIIVTDQNAPQATYDQLVSRIESSRVLPLDVLGISPASDQQARSQ
jgi:hypothetical protein